MKILLKRQPKEEFAIIPRDEKVDHPGDEKAPESRDDDSGL